MICSDEPTPFDAKQIMNFNSNPIAYAGARDSASPADLANLERMLRKDLQGWRDHRKRRDHPNQRQCTSPRRQRASNMRTTSQRVQTAQQVRRPHTVLGRARRNPLGIALKSILLKDCREKH